MNHQTPALQRARAFTLIELLVVISLMAVLFGLAATAFRGMSGVNLSTSVVQVQSMLVKARQVALSSNKYTQVRFYKRTAGSARGYEAIGMFVAESPYYSATEADYNKLLSQKLMRAEGNVEYLPTNFVIPDDAASALLKDLKTDTGFTRTGTATLRGESYSWVGFYFRPNGATDYQEVSGQTYDPLKCFFSVVQDQEYGKTVPSLPTNYAIFTVSPANGMVNVVRP